METEDSEQLTKKQLFALLESAQNYMRQISTFSQKICRSQTKHSYLSVNLVRSVLDDYSMTPKKKLFALRFIKDTLVLSSHCFYIFCVIKILPWIVQIFKQGDKMKDNGLSYLVQKISKTPADTQVQTISKSILQLMEQILKWTGTNINLHPFYKIKYPSAFKLYLDCFDKVKALKVTQLTFYKIQDLQRYQNQYLQEELNIQDWTQIQNQFIDMLLTNTICLPLDDPEKQLSRNLLQNIVQIGDSLWIRKIIEIMKPLIQSPVTGYQSILLLHDLMKVRQIQFCIGIRNQLLEIIGYYLLMMNKETFSKTQNINLLDICRYLFVWKLVTESLGAQTKAYDELFGKLKQQWVVANQQEYQANIQSINFVYKPILKITDVNNKQKLHNFNIRESTKIWEGIKKLKYIKISQEQSQKQKQNQLMAELQKQVEQIKMKNPSKVSSKVIEQKIIQQNSVIKSKEIQLELKKLKENSQKNNSKNQQKNSNILISRNLNNSKNSQKKKLSDIQSPIQLMKNQAQLENSQKSHDFHKNNSQKNQQPFIKFENSLQSSRNKNNIYTNKLSKEIFQQNNSSKSSRLKSKNSKILHKGQKIQKASSLSISLKKVKSSSDLANSIKSSLIQQNKSPREKLNIIKFQNSQQFSQQIHQKENDSNRQSHEDNHPFQQSKVIYFDQNYYSRTKNTQKNIQMKPCQKIKVLQTVRKPKFGFNQQELYKNQEESVGTNQQQKQRNYKRIQRQLNLDNLDSSQTLQNGLKKSYIEQINQESINPSIVQSDHFSKYSSVPSNFNDVLKINKKQKYINDSKSNELSKVQGVKFNKFPHKIKQLEAQIQRTKKQQEKIQKLMKEKDQLADQLKKSMPNDNKFYIQQNQRLRKQLMQKSSNNIESTKKFKEIKYNPTNLIHQPLTKIYPVYSKPLSSTFKKMIISNKCLVQKNSIFQLGYAYKSDQKQICLYLKFLIEINQIWLRVWNNSLKLKEDFQTNLYNIVPNQQIKFSLIPTGFSLLDEEFQSPIFQIHVKSKNNKNLKSPQKGQRESHLQKGIQNFKIPCSLFTFLIFKTPKNINSIKFAYATDWHECSQQFLQFEYSYLMNIFKKGYYQKEQLKNNDKDASNYKNEHNNSNNKIQDGFLIQVQDCFNLKQHELDKKYKRVLRIKKQKSKFYIQSNNNFQKDKYILKGLLSILQKSQKTSN